MNKWLLVFGLVCSTFLIGGCVSAPENDQYPTALWGSQASKDCCIWTAKGPLGKAGSRSYEYKVQEDGVLLIKTDGTAFIDGDRQSSPIGDWYLTEPSKICKREFGTEARFGSVTKPTRQLAVLKYPKIIEAACYTTEEYAPIAIAEREAAKRKLVYAPIAIAEREAAKRKLDQQKKTKDLAVWARELGEASSVTTRKAKCTSYGFEPDTDAHAKCVMELSIAAEDSSPPPASNSSASIIRQQAIQKAKLKEQKRIADMEANFRLIELGASLMNGGPNYGKEPQSQIQTYIINGQTITCRTSGRVINCF